MAMLDLHRRRVSSVPLRTCSSSTRTICVRNLRDSAQLWAVESLFSCYKPISVELRLPQRRPGRAYIEFKDPSDAKAAVQGRNGYKFDGIKLHVELARAETGHDASLIDRCSDAPSHATSRVLVTNIPSSATRQDLKAHMSRAGGTVLLCQLLRQDQGLVGIVDYTEDHEMESSDACLQVTSHAPQETEVGESSERRRLA